MDMKIALIVVDYQIDFITGSLALGAGTAGQNPLDALSSINNLISEYEEAERLVEVIYTRDAHPPDHISFLSAAKNSDRELLPQYQNKELKLFDTVQFKNKLTPQTLYPDHCVEGTPGVEFHPDLKIIENAEFIDKAKGSMVESYSGFLDNDRTVQTGLYEKLKSLDVDTVVICGIAYDICVRATALDAAELGFNTAVAYDACAGLDKDGIVKTDVDFAKKNILKLTSLRAQCMMNGTLHPFQ